MHELGLITHGPEGPALVMDTLGMNFNLFTADLSKSYNVAEVAKFFMMCNTFKDM